MQPKYEPLNKDEVKESIRGECDVRPPAHRVIWPGEGLREYHGEEAVDEVFAPYQEDVLASGIAQPGGWKAPEGFSSDYRWGWHDPEDAPQETAGKDAGGGILYDWEHFDEFMDAFPQADDPRIFDNVSEVVEKADGQYVVAWAWNNFYERLWSLRGMKNVLMDFHLHKEEMKTLCEALKDLVLKFVEGAGERGADGFATSNDLGHQTGLMMSPETFREFLKPLHEEVAATCHEYDMDYWIHSCGDLTDILEDLIEVEVDCLHPLQYGAMDWDESARIIGDRMTAWAGVDVQHILQEESPEGVREHVRDLIDTFYVPGKGRCVVAAGNGITGSTPLENIDAFLDETFRYGLAKAGE